MSESLRLFGPVADEPAPIAGAAAPKRRRRGLGVRLALVWEVVTGGLIELWAHKLRSMLTLTLLMLGVFALVVMTSVLDGVQDKIATGSSIRRSSPRRSRRMSLRRSRSSWPTRRWGGASTPSTAR